MAATVLLSLSLFSVFLAASSANPVPPVWPDVYFAEGVLRLPYAELDEPFVAFFDTKRTQRSRINFYGGE